MISLWPGAILSDFNFIYQSYKNMFFSSPPHHPRNIDAYESAVVAFYMPYPSILFTRIIIPPPFHSHVVSLAVGYIHDHGNSIIQFDYRKCTVFNFQHFRGVFAVSYAMFIMLMLAFAWSATRLHKFSQDFPLYCTTRYTLPTPSHSSLWVY